MKKFILTFLLFSFIFPFVSAADWFIRMPIVKVPSETKDNIDIKQAQNVVVIINHINWSIAKITAYNDPIVLEQEYEALSLNNLYLSSIKDFEIVESIKNIYNIITDLRINEGDRKILHEVFEQEKKNAIYGALPSPSAIISPNIVALTINLAQSSVSSYANYQKAKKDLELKLKKDTWELDKIKLKRLNEFWADLLKQYYDLIRKYNLDDYWRVTDSDCKELIERLKDNDEKRLYEYLVQSQERFKKLPIFWYYLGVYSIKNDNFKGAKYAFDTYQTLFCQIVRKDEIAASVSMNYIRLLIESKDRNKNTEIKRHLEIIEKNSSDGDFSFRYFCGLAYWNLLKDSDNAIRILKILKNHLDHTVYNDLAAYRDWWGSKERDELPTKEIPKTEALMQTRIALVDIVAKKTHKDSIKIFNEICNKNTISNTESLYYVGRLNTDAIYKNIEDEIRVISISHKSKWMRTDSFYAKLPLKWFLLEDIKPELEFYSKGELKKRVSPKNDNPERDENGMLVFEYKYEGDHIIDNKIDCIKLSIPHKFCPVKVVFSTKDIMDKTDNKWLLSYNRLLPYKAEFMNKTYNFQPMTKSDQELLKEKINNWIDTVMPVLW